MKSSKVGKNHVRRIAILNDIVKLDCSIYAVIVDKRKLNGEGFKYKKSFYKYLNNLLYKELFRTFPKLDLYVDEHGGNDYMLEFKKYVKKHHKRNLFSGSEFDIKNSKNHKLIQLADFVAGTLGYIYDENKKSEKSETFLKILEPLISDLNFFPKDYSFAEIELANTNLDFDPVIAKMALLRVQTFLKQVKGDNQQERDQINFLKLMLLLQRVYHRSRFVSTGEIFRHLNVNRNGEIKEEYFRSKVIGNLRDKGVIIASGRKGYKIPENKNDLDAFVKHGSRIILPMINRLLEARNAIKLATKNDLDLFADFKGLRDLLD